ncbi:MAG: type II toxin-antitoxin system VapC family toxin [bacterium]
MILDSNIIIYSAVPENIHIREYLKKNEKELAVSAISKVEVLGYYKLTSDERNTYEHFFQNINIFDVNSTIIERAVTLRQQKKMSLGDSIIAATALLHNHKLFTNNEEDFMDISGLEIMPMSSI